MPLKESVVTEEADPEITIGPDGTKEWYRNGKRHRDGGPAIEWFDGTKVWFQNGQLHREDGPAYEGRDGDDQYHLFDVELTFDEFCKRRAEMLQQEHDQRAVEKSALMEAIEKAMELQGPMTVKGPLKLKKFLSP